MSVQSLQDTPAGILLLQSLFYANGGIFKKSQRVYLAGLVQLFFQFLGLLIIQRDSYKFIVYICRGFKADDVSVNMFSQIILDISAIRHSPVTIVLGGFQERLSASVNK